MPTCIDVKFIFDSVHLGLSSSANTLQIADVALQVVVFLFLLCFFAVISPSSSRSSYAWNEWNARHIFFCTAKTTVHYPVVGCIFDVISSLNTKFFQIWSSVTGFG